jgi:hypothetical protein
MDRLSSLMMGFPQRVLAEEMMKVGGKVVQGVMDGDEPRRTSRVSWVVEN